MEEKNLDPKMRRRIILTLGLVTVLFFAVLGGLLLVRSRIPIMREQRLQEALEQGDLAQVRELAAQLEDEDKARSYLVECDYLEARSLMEEGRWEEASVLLSAASGYQDAAELKAECSYRMAEQLLSRGEYEDAEQRFLALGSYRDAMDRCSECRFLRAQALEADGMTSEAAVIYSQLGDYPGARERLYAMATSVTGIEDPETAVAALQGQTPEELAHMAALSAAREALPRQIIDVGFFHTIGLASDGTVLACGDNSFGQCNTGSLSHVTAVAAGAYHSLALHEDGTVSAFGRNSESQCEVGDWRDIVQIAAADYASFGLRSDGTLLCVGYNNYDKPMTWAGLTGIIGGSYNLAALRSDGGAWVYPALSGGEKLQGLVDLAVNTGFAVGVCTDGSVIGTAFTPENWSDILRVSASGTVVLGLRADGHVLCHAFRHRDQLPLESVSDAVAVAAGGTHSAVVLSDGSVLVFGDNSHGEGLTDGWKLAVSGR